MIKIGPNKLLYTSALMDLAPSMPSDKYLEAMIAGGFDISRLQRMAVYSEQLAQRNVKGADVAFKKFKSMLAQEGGVPNLLQECTASILGVHAFTDGRIDVAESVQKLSKVMIQQGEIFFHAPLLLEAFVLSLAKMGEQSDLSLLYEADLWSRYLYQYRSSSLGSLMSQLGLLTHSAARYFGLYDDESVVSLLPLLIDQLLNSMVDMLDTDKKSTRDSKICHYLKMRGLMVNQHFDWVYGSGQSHLNLGNLRKCP
ncbi:MAG: hypothetical protein ABIE74_09435 [Pseudomonadota bacterium]